MKTMVFHFTIALDQDELYVLDKHINQIIFRVPGQSHNATPNTFGSFMRIRKALKLIEGELNKRPIHEFFTRFANAEQDDIDIILGNFIPLHATVIEKIIHHENKAIIIYRRF